VTLQNPRLFYLYNGIDFDDTTINAVLQSVAYGLQSTYHSSLAASPGQLVFGCDMIINAVYLANWKDLHARRDIQICHNNSCENKSHIPHLYAPGNSVYIRKPTFIRNLTHCRAPLLLTRSTLMVPLRHVVRLPFPSESIFVDFTLHLHTPIREARAVR
jgi:hypothetical protein